MGSMSWAMSAATSSREQYVTERSNRQQRLLSLRTLARHLASPQTSPRSYRYRTRGRQKFPLPSRGTRLAGVPKHETKARFRVSAGVVRLLRPAPYITPSTRPKQHASQRSRLRPVIWTLASLPEILASCSRTYGCIEPAIQQRTTSLDAEKRDISTREGPGAKRCIPLFTLPGGITSRRKM